MKPFVFKLQTALDIKLKEEDMQKEELSRATKVYRDNLAFLKSLLTRLGEIQDILRGKQVRRLDVAEIRGINDYVPVLEERIKKQEETTENSRQEMEQVRQRLIETMRDRKVLEKLKTRHFQEYMREAQREEQKQIDEMATVGYVHRDPAV